MKNIYWYAPEKVFSSFKNEMDNPSFRLRCYHLHKNLLANGFNSRIVSRIEDIKNPDIVTLMSFGQEEFELAKWVRSKKGHVLHDFCENITGIPILEETKKICSLIVCASSYLGDEQRKYYGDRVVVVKDPFEDFPIKHRVHSSNKLKVGWSGMGGNAYWVEELLKPLVESLDMDYVEISNREESTVKWDIESWYYHLASCDVSLCPQPHWQAMGKSNVKVTTSMSLGVPVVASPIPSYKEIVEHGKSGFICEDLEDWEKSLYKLKSTDFRKYIVKDYDTLLVPYKSENIFQDWLYYVSSLFRR